MGMWNDHGTEGSMADSIEEKLASLGLKLPPVSKPAGNYLSCKQVGDLLYVGGHGPVTAEGVCRGKVGAEITLDRAQQAARDTALSMLASVKAELGDLSRIRQVIRVFGMVNCAPGFQQTPAVLDGCSDLLVSLFGENGRHVRCAVGMAELPFDIPVEIEMLLQID